jgi:aminomuconate-semialdehyde/2-hydroxymuconate-6-semialdehyde dehydrogenase
MPIPVNQSAETPSACATPRTLHHFIDGEFVPSLSGETFENINPATGEVLSQVARGDAADIDRAAKAARKAFEAGVWSRLPMRERCDKLREIGDRILDKLEPMAKAETQDTGKPISESRGGDIPRSAQNFHFYSEFAAQLGEDCYTVDPMERHFTVREPLGVAGLITPWNLPLYLSTWKIAPALAMGNSVILKPAEWTPTTATLLAEIFQEADMPSGVFNVVHGFGAGEAGEALTRHPDVAAISFTGETGTGKAIMRAAADTLKKVSFELGGKGATIIFDDADLEAAIPVALRAAFRNQGQICLSGSRVFVQRSVLDAFLPKLLAAVEKLRVGDPLLDDTQMGSVISREQLEKIESYIALGRQEGRLLSGGHRLETEALGRGFFLKPTVFCDLANTSRLCQEEIFGPVLPVVAFDTEEEVLSMVNSTPYGLSASIWSQNVNRCHRVSQGIRTGIVWVNCWFARDLRTPFGGMKASGVGREGGRYSLDFFSEAKAVCYRYQ